MAVPSDRRSRWRQHRLSQVERRTGPDGSLRPLSPMAFGKVWLLTKARGLVCLIPVLFGSGCETDAVPVRPNFVVIFIDDMGYGDIGPFGSTLNDTPHLDRMAAEGMRLTSFYSASPVCTPSRAALMTGSYPKRVGLATGPVMRVLWPGEPWGLHEDEVTIAEILQGQGYATACIGKWHLGDQPEFLPTRHGFDEYFGIPYSNDMWALHPRAPEGGVYDFPPLPLIRGTEVVGEVRDMKQQAELCQQFTDETISFIRRNKDRPFFVYIPHAFIHHPRVAREPFMASAGLGPDEIDWSAITAGSPWHCDSKGRCGPGETSPEDWSDLVARHTKAQIEEVDWSVGVVLDALRDADVAERTMVLFTSDNGGASGTVNAPLRGGKGSTWEGGMRVPALAWWPGTIPAGSASDETVSTIDVLPTLANLSGASVPRDRILDGRDISEILLGIPGASSPHEAFFYFEEHELQAVRSGRWKLFLKRGELFDLNADIGETTDVSASNPEVVERLRGYFNSAMADLGTGRDQCPQCRPAGTVEDAKPLIPHPSRP